MSEHSNVRSRHFPLLIDRRSLTEGYTGPIELPWSLMDQHAAQAMRNHGQTLDHLASRGGLSPCEAVAVLEDRRWSSMTGADAGARLRAFMPLGDT